MKYRIYYRIQGAPENRPGGAWWYRDFFEDHERSHFRISIQSLCAEIYLLEGQDLLKHNPMQIKPLPGSRRVKP